MWRIIKAEISYQSELLWLGILPLIAYLSMNLIPETFMRQIIHWYRDFWIYTIGIMMILMFYTMVFSRLKEKRDRMNMILPLSLGKISLARIFVLLIPPVSAMIFITVLNFIFFWGFRLNVLKIFSQISKYMVILPSLGIVFDQWFSLPLYSKWKKIFLVTAIIVTITLITVLINLYLDPFFCKLAGECEITPALIWSTILFFLLFICFKKRDSYLI